MPLEIPSSEDLSYIAGIIDGEGYIGLCAGKERRRKKETGYYYPMIKISMCDIEALNFISRFFKGNWYKSIQKINHKPVFTFSIIGQKNCRVILGVIIPYLKIKDKQAKILLQFIDSRKNVSKKIKWGESSYTLEHHQYYNDIRKLNKKGGLYVSIN